MRPFLELLGDCVHLADTERLAATLAPGELDALRAEGFLQPTGSAGFEEVSVPDVVRLLRALWGAGSGGLRTRAKLGHAPMLLGWLEIDDEPCELVLCADDRHAIAAAARRRERALVLVPTERAVTPELRRRHGSRARVRVVVLCEQLGVHGGRVCRVDLPVPMPAPLPPRARATAHGPALPSRPSHGNALDAERADAWEALTFTKLDKHTLRVRFGRLSRRLTAQDLGLTGTRSRRTSILFEMLMAFCENGGRLKTGRFGNAQATKTTLSRLRAKLRAAFGIEGDPFLDYKPGLGWSARFQVADGESVREQDLSPAARAMLRRAGKLR